MAKHRALSHSQPRPETRHSTTVAFHPNLQHLFSAVSDGAVSIWDHNAKKRLRQYPTAVAFNSSMDEGENGPKIHIIVLWLGIKNVGSEVKVSLSLSIIPLLSGSFLV